MIPILRKITFDNIFVKHLQPKFYHYITYEEKDFDLKEFIYLSTEKINEERKKLMLDINHDKVKIEDLTERHKRILWKPSWMKI